METKSIKTRLKRTILTLMFQNSTSKSPIVYGVAVWIILNIALMALIIVNGDFEDLNNWIEIALYIAAIPAVLSGKKWGFAFTIFVLVYTLSTSVGILIYYQIWLNAIRVVVNLPIVIYLFRVLIAGKTK